MLSQAVCYLSTEDLPENKEGSHLCHNVFQRCFNLSHVVWEIRLDNESRNYCGMGARCLCEHDPKCIFTGINNEYTRHQNRDDSMDFALCDCEVPCSVSTFTRKRPREDNSDQESDTKAPSAQEEFVETVT